VKATPYINHPLAPAQALCEERDVRDPVILAAALLHDTIEDTETSYDELRGQFGARIAGIIAEVTDTKFLGKQSRKREYFDWAKAVVDQVRGANPGFAERFDAVWEVGRMQTLTEPGVVRR